MAKKKTKADLTKIEMFCLDAYIVNGDADTAYLLSRKKELSATEESKHKLALMWIRTPHVAGYLDERRAATFGAKESVGRFRDKDAVLSALEAELPYLKGKDRLDALMKIADLQQLKKEETASEQERVHFYLPLQVCDDCDRKKALIDRNKDKLK